MFTPATHSLHKLQLGAEDSSAALSATLLCRWYVVKTGTSNLVLISKMDPSKTSQREFRAIGQNMAACAGLKSVIRLQSFWGREYSNIPYDRHCTSIRCIGQHMCVLSDQKPLLPHHRASCRCFMKQFRSMRLRFTGVKRFLPKTEVMH